MTCLFITGCFPEEAQLRKERDSRNFEAQATQIALAMIEYGALWSDTLAQLGDWDSGALTSGEEGSILPPAEHPYAGPGAQYLQMSYCIDDTNLADRREYILVYPPDLSAIPGQLERQAHRITKALADIAGTESVGTIDAAGNVRLAGNPRDGASTAIDTSACVSSALSPSTPVYVLNLQYRGGRSEQYKKSVDFEVLPCTGGGNFYVNKQTIEWFGDLREAARTKTPQEIFCPLGGGP